MARFNPDRSMEFEIVCGAVCGRIQATSAGDAFRKIMKKMKKTRKDFSPIARFRQIKPSRTIWFFQDSEYLMKEK